MNAKTPQNKLIMDSPTDEYLIDKYFRRLGHDVSPRTVEAYRADVGRLLAWMEGTSLELLTMTHADLREFVMTLTYAGLSPASVARVVSGVRSFYKELVWTGTVKKDPTLGLIIPQREHRLPRFLNSYDAELLVQSASGAC